MTEQGSSGNDGGAFSPSDIVKQFLNWGVFPHPGSVFQATESSHRANPGGTPRQHMSGMIRRAQQIAGGQGVVAALPGAVPGVGTAAQLAIMGGTAVPETVLLLRKMAHLQLCAAHLCGEPIVADGNPDQVHPDRVEEFAVVMGLMTGVIVPVKEAAKKFGGKFATVTISRHLPGSVLRAINRRVGFTLLTKFGTKRGGIALGKLIPLGIGAVIGGGMNYHAVGQFGHHAIRFYFEQGEYAIED